MTGRGNAPLLDLLCESGSKEVKILLDKEKNRATF